jgi:hypothetical protein
VSGTRGPEEPVVDGRKDTDTGPAGRTAGKAVGDAAGENESVRALRAEPEPAWADAIRRGRRSRAERLRTVFATFDDEELVPGGPVDDAPRREPRRP